MINLELRNTLSELFPEILFYDSPVNDDSIMGLACVYDDGFHWVIVYNEDMLLNHLKDYFNKKSRLSQAYMLRLIQDKEINMATNSNVPRLNIIIDSKLKYKLKIKALNIL